MTFDEVLEQIRELLVAKGRVTYRALKVRFELTDEYLEACAEELIEAERVAVDENGKVLVWTGGKGNGETENRRIGASETLPHPPAPNTQSPVSYTPPHLADRIRAEQAALDAKGATGGERKTITALFADLKGSTALIEGLDPEEARRVIDPALQLMMDAVHRYEGYVAQSLGDGIFALFGAPLAHEDHAHRALYAALKMQDDMRRYAEQRRQQGLQPVLLRVGVNTGEVVLRSIRKDDLQADYVPIGHSTNIAARLESLATPGAIVVSEDTFKLTDGFFTFQDLGLTQVKGASKPLQIYELRGTGPLRTRLQVTAARGLSRFVGRQTEVTHLQHTLEHVLAGRGQIVGVMGEPGVGKSRLVYEFKVLAQRQCLILDTFSVSHSKAYPYLPLIELLKQYCQLTSEDTDRKRREKIMGKVLALDRSLEDTLPYLFALLGLAESPGSLSQMDPQIRKQRTFDAIKRILMRESLNQPIVVVFEDLHWLDSETQAFLTLFSESVASAKILLLVNYRPEYQHSWGNKTYYSQLRLDPLGPADAQELLSALVGDNAALAPWKRFIFNKTDGNPFFIEEIVHELFEQGVLAREGGTTRPVTSLPAELHLPTTVQGVLAARIDRLPAVEKGLLQTLAVIGRQFPRDLVQQVVAPADEALPVHLAHLQAAEFIYEQPAFPEPEYTFKHALTQEVAYNSLLSERRKALHAQTAGAIERLYQGRLDEYYSELAHHYSRSENTEKAIEYLHKAGQQAVQRSAHVEAVSHFTTALELLKTLPETPEHTRQELSLEISLGPALMATKGYAAPEVEHAYSRAYELCRQIRETSQLFPALWGLWMCHFVRAELRMARRLGEQLLTLARSIQDPALLLEAHIALGETLYFLGENASARELLEQGVSFYDAQQHHSLAFLYAQNPGVMCRSLAAFALWQVGYPDRALRMSQEAIALAQELEHPHTLAFALTTATWTHNSRREIHLVKERATAVMTLAAAHELPFWKGAGTIQQGYALAKQELAEEGIELIHQGIDALRAMTAKLQLPRVLILLAEVYGDMGETKKGLSLLAETLPVMSETGDCHWQAELYRLKGELTLQQLSLASSQLSVLNPQSLTPNTQHPAPRTQHPSGDGSRSVFSQSH